MTLVERLLLGGIFVILSTAVVGFHLLTRKLTR